LAGIILLDEDSTKVLGVWFVVSIFRQGNIHVLASQTLYHGYVTDGASCHAAKPPTVGDAPKAMCLITWYRGNCYLCNWFKVYFDFTAEKDHNRQIVWSHPCIINFGIWIFFKHPNDALMRKILEVLVIFFFVVNAFDINVHYCTVSIQVLKITLLFSSQMPFLLDGFCPILQEVSSHISYNYSINS
jgi:hypothetical protein